MLSSGKSLSTPRRFVRAQVLSLAVLKGNPKVARLCPRSSLSRRDQQRSRQPFYPDTFSLAHTYRARSRLQQGFTSFGSLSQQRSRFLAAAIEDTLRWCGQPDATIVGNHPTDQFWIRAFALSAPQVDAATTRPFLATFKPVCGWDYHAAAEIINDLPCAVTFVPERDIPPLAQALGRAQKRDVVCTLAASKLAHAIFPKADVHVWHDLAVRSVLSATERLVLDSCAGEYATYHAGCRRVFRQETTKADFVEAASPVPTRCGHLQGHSRIMPSPTPSSNATYSTGCWSTKDGTSSTVACRVASSSRLRRRAVQADLACMNGYKA